jgi:hypothetical protein
MALPEPAPALSPLGAPLITTHRIISYTYPSTSPFDLAQDELRTGDAVGNRLSLTTHTGLVNYQGLSPAADHESWLTRTAEIRRPARPLHFADGAAAAWAWLAGLAVHCQEIAHLHIYGVAHACAEHLNGLGEHGLQG